MATYSKIMLAMDMVSKSYDNYVNAKTELDYISSILLSGASLGIIQPLIRERGGKSFHKILETLMKRITLNDRDIKAHEGVFRQTYNSIKHAGNVRQNILPSDDLYINTNFKKEASRMLKACKEDFLKLNSCDVLGASCLPIDFVEFLENINIA